MNSEFMLDGRNTRIVNTTFKDWWTLQQLFAYPPFEEFFNSDKLIDYWYEFSEGGVYQLEINVSKDIWIPVGLISWRPIKKFEHPVSYNDNYKVAYISDSITYKAYQNHGVQKELFKYLLKKLSYAEYDYVYLRTSPESNMCHLAHKLGFHQIGDVEQAVKTPRVGNIVRTDSRIFFEREVY